MLAWLSREYISLLPVVCMAIFRLLVGAECFTAQHMILTLQTAIWTIGAFDSCVHMSEEASNAAKAVPLGILSSIGMCWGLGFVIVIVLAACMNQDVDAVLGSSFGQPVSDRRLVFF